MTAHRGNAGDSVSRPVTPSDHLKPSPKPGSLRKHIPEAGAKIGSKGRTKGLTRRTPVKKRNAKRNGSRFPKRRDPAYCAWIRTMPCVVIHCPTWGSGKPVECAHVKTRGAGGDDVGNTVPLCRYHHRQQHQMGIKSFQRAYGCDLARFAAELAAYHLAAHPQRDTA